MSDTAIKIEGLKKQYRLGVIGGTTLNAELQSWWARKLGKTDPNSKIGAEAGERGAKFWALNGIDLEVKKGEALGIIGTNGAGKSTLLKILSRVTAPTEGDIWMEGRVSSMLEVGTGFHPELTGRENIYMNGAILGMSKAEISKKMDEIIDFSECRQFIDTPVKRYSSGMYVKLAFSVAAHLDAEIMVMDEVLAVGDVKFQEKCLGKMGNEATSGAKTVLYVSHNMGTIRQLCTRCIVLSHGQLIYDGDVDSAIDVYMDNNKKELKQYYDLTSVRSPSPDHGSNIFMKSFEFIVRNRPIYGFSDKIRFRIEWTSKTAKAGLRFYFSLVALDSTVAGTAMSDVFADAKDNDHGMACFEFDASNLAEGTYTFNADIFTMNEYGSFRSVDHPLQSIAFEIVKDGTVIQMDPWMRKYFGNVRLNTMSCVAGANSETNKN